MSQELNFPAVTNNDVLVELIATRKSDGSLVDLTGYYIKVSIFAPGTNNPLISYDTTGHTVTILNQSSFKGQAQFTIAAADTKDLPAGDYPWEPVTVSPDDIALTITNDDLKLTSGVISFRRQKTVQA